MMWWQARLALPDMAHSPFFQWLIPPPITADADGRSRQAYFLTITMIVVALLIGVVDWSVGYVVTMQFVLAGMPWLLFSLVLIHRGRTDAGVLILLSVVLVLLTSILAVGNGIHSTGLVLYPVIAMIAGAMVGRRAFVAFLALVVLSVTLLATGEIYRFLPAIHLPGKTWWDDLVVVVLILIVAAVSIRSLMDARDRVLRRAIQSEEALTDKVRKLQILREISLLYSQELDLRALAKRIHEVFPKYYRSTTAHMLLYDARVEGLVSDDRFGFNPAGQAMPGQVQRPGESISGRAFQERRPIVIDDCHTTDAIPRRWVEILRLRSCLAVPLLLHDRTLGVLRIDNTERSGAFSPEDVAFFQMLADQIAVAISNHELFEERQRVEAALREGESRFRMLAENVSDFIWSADLDFNYRFISLSEESMFGWTPQEWMHLRPESYLTPAAARLVKETLQLELARNREPGVDLGRSVNLELEQRRKDGSTFWTEVTARFLWTGGSEPTGLIGVTRDITDRKRAEEKVLEINAQLEQRVRERTSQLEGANQELEAFSYSVSHDLRAPIRHILGFLKLLEEDVRGHLSENGTRHLRTLEGAAQRMARLIDDLLRLSRLSRSEMRAVPTDLTNIARMIWSRLELSEPDRQIVFTAGPTTSVLVDPGLIEVALENLLANARKFTGKRKGATVEFGEVAGERGPVLFVRDNGAGFDMAYAPKLFGVFQRLHGSDEYQGTGVGLATVHRIVERHRGRIWAEGVVDRGATFFFTLPLA